MNQEFAQMRNILRISLVPACRKFLLLVAASGFACGQTARIAPMRIPAPIWPGEAGASAYPGQNVFYDLVNSQAVIVTLGANGAVAAEVRRDIPNRAAPSVSFSLQRSQERLVFSYALTDPAAAKQRTKQVSVLLPDHDSGLTAAGWPSRFEATTLPDHSATVSMATMRKLIWEDSSISTAKIQGLQLTLQSAYLPGFGDMEVQGLVGNPITSTDLAGFNPTAAKQLAAFLEPGLGSTRYTVLLPLFRQDTSKLVIASNYFYWVQLLSRKKTLDASSPYIIQLTAALRQFLSQGGQGALPVVAATPAAPLEQTIQTAVAVAFQ